MPASANALSTGRTCFFAGSLAFWRRWQRLTVRLTRGRSMRRRACLPASHVRRLDASSVFPCSTPRRTGGRLFVALPPNSRKSGPHRKIALPSMNCFGISPAQKACSSRRTRMRCAICAFRLDCRQTTSRSSIVGDVRHSAKSKRRGLVTRISLTKVGSLRGSNGGRIRGRGRNSADSRRPHRQKHLYRRHTNFSAVMALTRTMCCVGPIAPQQNDITPI